MSTLEAIILALVQGVAAFLPVSALAHRTVIGVFLGFGQPTAALELALEAGCLLAVVLCFAMDWLQIAANAFGLQVGRDPELRRLPRLLWILIAASAPLALTSYWLMDWARASLGGPFFVGSLLIVIALAMGWADGASRRQKTIDHLGFADALLIGLVQSLAVLPGASRVAVTLTAGTLLNFDRAAAARISYLMATPVLAGRTWLALRRLLDEGGLTEGETLIMAVATLITALAGCATIAFFTEFLRQGTLRPFARYRLAFGIMVIALALLLR